MAISNDPQKIIIDTDPGQDDAAAIMLALASPELDVLGITTVAGNVPLHLTSRNARVVCDLCGAHETRVFAGADRPLQRELFTAEYIHGKTGLDGMELFDPRVRLQSKNAITFIIDTLLNEPPQTVTLCTLGPLTNIASALRASPEIAPRIRRIVMMGGGFFEGGNVTPAAEFNVYVDPEAAATVFESGVPIVMIPLDVTHQVLTTPERIGRIESIGNPAAVALAGMLRFFERFDVEKYGTEGAPLHDPTVIACTLCPELFGGRDCNVEIETGSQLTRGMTVVDWWQVTKRPHNAHVMRMIDSQGFFDLLTARLANLPKDI